MAGRVDHTTSPVLVGMGGHARVVIEILRLLGLPAIGYCDRSAKPAYAGQLPYLGIETNGSAHLALQANPFLVAIGDNLLRRKLIQSLLATDYTIAAPIIHPHAHISPSATIEVGSQIMAGAIVNSSATIGLGCIINSNSIVEHDCTVGAYCHVAPGAALAGDVKLGEGAFVGLNACIVQGVKIGAGVFIGAGAVVIDNVPAGTTVVGNPARIIQQPK